MSNSLWYIQVAAVLEELSQGTQDDALMAYQIAFDLYESATQQFLNNVVQAVRKTAPIPAAVTIGGSSTKGIHRLLLIIESFSENNSIFLNLIFIKLNIDIF